MDSKPAPQWPKQPHLEALMAEGRLNPYPGTEEIAAKEGKDWWRFDENGQPYDEEDDPEDD